MFPLSIPGLKTNKIQLIEDKPKRCNENAPKTFDGLIQCDTKLV